jgi:hypothetical protein
MAERRMFAKSIVDSDMFLDMPLSTQALYFHLAMRADDEGFINNPSKIQRVIAATKNDLDLLVAKRFLLSFESGVIVVKHWKIHNYIRNDRFKSTLHIDEKSQLEIKTNGAYTYMKSYPQGEIPVIEEDSNSNASSLGIPNDNQMDTQVRLGKVRLGKVSNTIGRFSPPTIQDVTAYCLERKNDVDPQRFIDHYESNGWMVGKTKMKDWKAAIRNWEKNQFSNRSQGPPAKRTAKQNFEQNTISGMSAAEMDEVLRRKQRKKSSDVGLL